MQAIAQKVLGNVLGKYIEGLEKNNIDVGLLSGTFKIENVALKKEISDMFNLPFNFKFNNVGKINAKIPWKSLSTSPVEIELEDIMVIAEPKSKEDLQLIALNIFKDRQKTLEDFASILEEKLKKKGKEEGPGYFAGLVTKIIDNVQVSIKNIHIRFECNLGQGQRYNFGITMDSLSIFTVDQNDKRVFLDRSKAENAKLPVHKKLNLSDFSLYWNEKELNPYYEPKFKREGTKMVEIPVTKEEKLKVINRLRETIPSGMGPVNLQAKKVERLNDFVYLLNLSIDAKMVQYTKTQELINKGIPEISLQFELDRLNSMLTKGQFGQIMGLMDYFSDYLAMAEKEVKKLRYKYLRPLKSITRSKLDPAHLKKANIKSWWRFAGRSIVMQNRENKGIYTLVGMNQLTRTPAPE